MGAADEFLAQATTMRAGRLVDTVTRQRRHSKMRLIAHGAFLHVIEDAIALVGAPDEWQEAEPAARRDPTRLWCVKKTLRG